MHKQRLHVKMVRVWLKITMTQYQDKIVLKYRSAADALYITNIPTAFDKIYHNSDLQSAHLHAALTAAPNAFFASQAVRTNLFSSTALSLLDENNERKVSK
jgi:hypothetical protein